MRVKRFRAGAVVVALAWAIAVPGQEQAAGEFDFAGLSTPPGERALVPYPDYPATRLWRFRHDGDLVHDQGTS